MDAKGYARRLWPLLVLFAFGWPAGAAAQAADGYRPLVGLRYLVDPRATAQVDDVLGPEARPAWRPLMGGGANFGFSDAAYWLRAELPPLPPAQWLIEIANPGLDRIDVYALVQGRPVLLYRAGEALPFAQRPVRHHNFLFPLPTTGPQASEVLLRVRSAGALQVPISLWRSEALLARTQGGLALHGLYFGVMLALLLYNLVAFAALRERSYLYLVGFITAAALFQAGLHGLSYQFLWPEAPAWNSRSLPFWAGLWAATGSAFAYCFLQLARRRRVLAMLLRANSLVALAMLPASLLLPYGVVAPAVTALAVIMVMSALAAGAALWRFSALARYFTLAWLVICIGTILLACSKSGLLPRTFLTDSAPQIGSAVGVLLLSAALARRFNRERARRRRAQAAARQQERLAQLANERVLSLQQTLDLSIEQAVRQRTVALDRRLQELTRQNAALDQANYIDSVTGLKNRRFFDERYRCEWRRAFREHYPLALVLIDVDGLNELNERLGRLAGDDCLRQLASVIEALAGRPTDTTVRFDDDEFAVLMAATPLQGAAHLAEAIRRQAEALGLGGSEGAAVTVSAGVAALTPSERHHEAVLLSFADDALYQAKASGRNRVKAFELPSGGCRDGDAQPA